MAEQNSVMPNLAGFVRRAGIPVSDVEGAMGDELAVALGHHPDGDVLVAFHEYAHFRWGEKHGNGTVRRAWAVNIGDSREWCLNEVAEGDEGAFPVTYWDPYWPREVAS